MIVRLDDAELKLRVEQALARWNRQKRVRQAEEKIGLRPGQAFDPNRVPEVAAARVALDLAEKNLRRAEKLIESGDVSRSFYDEQRAQRDQLKEQYEAALAQARQNYAAVAVARTNVANAEAQLALARKNLSYALSLSPIDGYVAERLPTSANMFRHSRRSRPSCESIRCEFASTFLNRQFPKCSRAVSFRNNERLAGQEFQRAHRAHRAERFSDVAHTDGRSRNRKQQWRT